MAGVSETQACPECGTSVPVLPGFLTWCHACDWNVNAPALELPAGPVDRIAARAGRSLGNRLAERLIHADALAPRVTPARLAAYAIAAGVHLLTIAFLFGGIVLLVLGFPNPVLLVAGVIAAGTGWLMRPRLGKEPDEGRLDRLDAPRLFDLVDEIASAVDASPAHVVIVTRDFNASWSVVGFRRRRMLTVGLPLLAALRPQERVALVAHELAHARNGDAGRGLFVGSAVRGLGEFYGVLAPGAYVFYGELAFVAAIANGMLWVLSRPLLVMLWLEFHLLMRDRQRAEYFADALSAEAAGTEAAVALQEKLLLESTVEHQVQRAMQSGDQTGDLFAAIAAAVEGVPARERDRRRRVARLTAARLDETHPPTALRIRLLEERPARGPRVRLDVAGAAAIDAELSHFRRGLQQALVDARRDRLYSGYR